MTTLFISDLHLDPSRPAITELFLDFLRDQARQAQALYILGDLFEAWIGDDTPSSAADAVATALRALHDAGVPVYFIRGNRDFLLGNDYAARAGMRILPDPAVIELYGKPVLLQHGDLLCTDDTAYQAFRTQTRDPAFQAQFLSQPLQARIAFAQQARAASQAHQSEMKEGDRAQFETVTDVAPAEVAATFQRYGVDTMIHGHTHRPAIHALKVGGRDCTRIVLGDWYEQGSVLRVDADGFTLDALG
ncbi:UDP-2,3-diacylglucosamine hydrolase [Stenotrophomonas pictorum JCM 9942]|uniref:UDP-2,3-diacylglucosamine hydrolase n=1 Tax=Stenotrophomonas pictorum JCM 9942 TaxID=1236960 RepID=A0A0R0AFF7_9GAMM|nr:UDP-2,3-diacylglucosamine diphosphatase [Stenotrophomonas pictorum]KRG43509.1 UDP-2,3-diacylglucosamine hydrolase [Stenotrophomonas pictorum JCM 9942]